MFSVGARLPAKSLTGWAAESLTGFNDHVLYVHTKYMLLDPLGDDPIVISGSANWSDPSVNANDENMLVIRGDKRVADIYLTDFMRLFDHFESRWQIIKKNTAGPKFVEAPVELVGVQGVAAAAAVVPEANDDSLKVTDVWWQEHYVAGSPRAREREVFSTRVGL
jgi:phosphatidylserine/phosphatidylglycerophosphate/cardiolipin synthase-like enzyme